MASDRKPGAIPFEEVLRQERQQIAASRQARTSAGREETAQADPRLVGLALSGGGVRSATFGLGILQGLARSGLLSQIDYLSGTGGGSYIAGFLSTWIHDSGYPEVEAQLGGERSSTEPPEIQGLRQSTVSVLGPGIPGSTKAVLTWLRNLALNLISMAALLGALLLLADLVLAGIWQAPSPAVQASCFAGAAAIVLAILSRRFEPSGPGPQARPWRFLAIFSTLAACALFSAVPRADQQAPATIWTIWLEIWPRIGAAIAAYCFLGWFPRKATLKALLAHTASAAVAGVAGGFLLSLLSSSFAQYQVGTARIELATPPVVVSLVVAVLLYRFLMGPWISKKVREVCGWLCSSLLYISAVWLLVALIWSLPRNSVSVLSLASALIVAIACIVGGMLSSVGLLAMRRTLQVIFDLLERISPFLFVLALAAAVAAPLTPIVQQTELKQIGIEAAVGVGLLIIGLFLVRRMAANELTMHGFQRTRIAQSYLASARAGASERTGRIGEGEVQLSDLVEMSGPYPLFGAALDGIEIDSSGSPQTRKVPFVLSPLLSGFDPRTAPKGAYRQTAELSAGVSLATAMAISGPLRENPRQPASAAISMLWTIFDLHDGRWMGNPLRDDTWYRSGPFLGATYALGGGFARLDREAAFVRPSGGFVFDNLGIYQLVKRHCRLIIACDASTDPTYTFPDLSVTIRRCRTDLGVDIEMDLGPLGRKGSMAGAHGQMAVVHYPDEEPGLMLYVKPSLTGDEPADLLQHATAHPDFPTAEAASGNFDEADFELYRRLGQHVVESLLAQVEKPAEMTVEQVFRAIRRQLQPNFKEPEAVSSSPAIQPPEAPPQELVDTIASRECVLWAGPGLAAQAKGPTWPSFLEGLLHVAREKSALDAEAATGLAATLGAGELEAVADELTHQMPKDALFDYVRSATSGFEPSQAHQLLAQMPFLGVLNTTFDELLASAFRSRVLVPAQTEELIKSLQAKSLFVANVLGCASQPSSLLFTLKEFRMLLAANLHFKQFLSTIFLRYNVLFVGSTIDGLRAYFEVLELPQTPERRHYALVANTNSLDPVKLRFLERSYNLHVVEYQPLFNYTGLPAFLEQLQSAVSEKVTTTRPAGAQVLKSVTLENIGPFDSLHLELTPTWNLLLGDNGVGKTVVLRAIAAALCGDKADAEAVARLLRSGTDSGSILLTDESREYKVELKREDGKVRCSAATLSPIRYDRWLVLGFPALRSIPWERPEGPSALAPEAPSAEDLLPILRGSVPDGRIADLKQWLINLDYAAGSEPPPSRSKKLLDDFFEILQTLTPGLRIKFHSIDKKTMEITVETDSGLVPLETVSQGTGSVMCWIGTLLERLSETGRKDALVLIDEIDAHMHPKWQQMFVSAFRKHFEEVQVIATTHSPLLVGSLEPEEIWLIHRAPLRSEIYGVVHLENAAEGTGQAIVVLGPEDEPEDGQPPAPREERRYRLPVGAELLVKEDEVVEEREPLATGKIVVAERLPFGPEGLRVDQILTSPLFNLETTRDPGTSALMSEYSSLTALENPKEEDQERLAEVAGQLQVRTATPQEQETARMAFGLIQDFASEKLKELAPEKRRKVLAEVRVQLTETITGSRRPE